MSCKYRQGTKTPNELFTGILEASKVSSNRIWGSCSTGMQCCGQAALCSWCRQQSLGLCCVPSVLPTALWKHLSAFLCLSFCPCDLWPSGPIAGMRSKRSGALWDKLVLSSYLKKLLKSQVIHPEWPVLQPLFYRIYSLLEQSHCFMFLQREKIPVMGMY